MALETEKYPEQCQETVQKEDQAESGNQKLQDELLNHLARSNATFKSQQKGEPDLTSQEKVNIARDLLAKSHCLFLSKFGRYLKPEHLKYFDGSKKTNYEVAYHINRLHRYFNNATRQRDIKNRRYEALKTLITQGEYFSESEMMKRNPLLYEQLVGQYMTEKQIMERDNIDNNSITYVSFLMETIERNVLRKRLKLQEAEEEGQDEEEEEDEDEEEEDKDAETDLNEEVESEDSTDNSNFRLSQNAKLIAENDHCSSDKPVEAESIISNKITAPGFISTEEKQLLKEEFISNMYQSFLEGKDIDFDYSTVDNNDAYDNIELRTQDEEEKYFDSESPEILDLKEESPVSDHQETIKSTETIAQSESEDELDIYMKSLKVN